MKKLVTILLVLGLASAAQADFTDDFDSGWAEGDPIVGNNGWLPYFEAATEFASGEIGAAGSGIGTTKGGIENTVSQPGAANTAGLTRYITDDFVNGQLTLQGLFKVDAGGGARLEVAPEENLTTATGGSIGGGYPENYTGYKIQMNSDGNAFWGTNIGGTGPGEGTYENFPGDQFARWDPIWVGWFGMKIHLDLNDVDDDGLTRSAYWSDVDESTGIADDWSYLGEFPGDEIALEDLDVAGVAVWDTNAGAGGTSVFDNFSSTSELVTGGFASDFDDDGDVDGDDFLNWQNHFPAGSGAVKSGGDADGDGDVDGDDFLIWQNEFPSPGAVANTPEPASLATILGLGGLLMLRRRRITGTRQTTICR